MQEWSEDYFFLELRLEDICQNIEYGVEFDLDGEDSKDIGISGLEGTIFDDVIALYAGFREDRITNLVSVFTGKFERCCKSYGDSMAFWLTDRPDSVDGEYYSSFSCVFLLYRFLGRICYPLFWEDFVIFDQE